MTRPSLQLNAVEPEVLQRRLDHLRQALGARRLGLARRLSAARAGIGPFEVLAVARGPQDSDREPGVPPEAIGHLLRHGSDLDWRRDPRSTARADVLRTWEAERIAGWALPADRRPSIYAVAIWGRGPAPGSRREETARLGLEALARALAPPDWLPLADLSRDSDLAGHHPLALVGESPLAGKLRQSYERLRHTPGPLLLTGAMERGLEALAEGLGEIGGPSRRLSVEELLDPSFDAGSEGWICHQVADLDAVQQAALLKVVESAVEAGTRGIFMATEELRARVRAGSFRPDLYWVIGSRQLKVPPLRLRTADVPAIACEVWRRHTRREVDAPAKVAKLLRALAWPGDLAQLEAEIRRLACEHPRARALRPTWFRRQPQLPFEDSMAVPPDLVPLDEAVAQLERRLLVQALRVADGNKTEAARRLHLSRQGLYRKLRLHGLWSRAGESQGEKDPIEPG